MSVLFVGITNKLYLCAKHFVMDKYKHLKEDGIAHGMCQKMQDEWVEPNLAQLCRMLFRGMDFCIEQDWPSVEQMKSVAPAEEAARYGVYYEDGVASGQVNICALGDAAVHVYVPAFGTCDIYARHNSKVYVHLAEHAFCYVSVLDNANVFVEEKARASRISASFFGGTIHNKELFDTIHDKVVS